MWKLEGHGEGKHGSIVKREREKKYTRQKEKVKKKERMGKVGDNSLHMFSLILKRKRR